MQALDVGDRVAEGDRAADGAEPVLDLLEGARQHLTGGVAVLARGEGDVEGHRQLDQVGAALVAHLVALGAAGEGLERRPLAGDVVEVGGAAPDQRGQQQLDGREVGVLPGPMETPPPRPLVAFQRCSPIWWRSMLRGLVSGASSAAMARKPATTRAEACSTDVRVPPPQHDGPRATRLGVRRWTVARGELPSGPPSRSGGAGSAVVCGSVLAVLEGAARAPLLASEPTGPQRASVKTPIGTALIDETGQVQLRGHGWLTPSAPDRGTIDVIGRSPLRLLHRTGRYGRPKPAEG